MKLLPALHLKTKIKNATLPVLDFLGTAIQFGIPGAGSAICFAVGKWVAGAVLLIVAVGVLWRLLWRRKHADRVQAQQRLPFWAKLLALLGALVGSATLVEMVKLPVRFDQPDFSMSHWLIVIAAILFLNSGLRNLLRAMLRMRPKSVSNSLTEKQ